jgi:hypothetical protein
VSLNIANTAFLVDDFRFLDGLRCITTKKYAFTTFNDNFSKNNSKIDHFLFALKVRSE